MAAKKALKRANPVLLEPVMEVEVVVPEEFMGDVMGDLSARRGHIQGMDSRGGGQVIRAMVPLSEMFGYATTVRSKTQVRAHQATPKRRYHRSRRSRQDHPDCGHHQGLGQGSPRRSGKPRGRFRPDRQRPRGASEGHNNSTKPPGVRKSESPLRPR